MRSLRIYRLALCHLRQGDLLSYLRGVLNGDVSTEELEARQIRSGALPARWADSIRHQHIASQRRGSPFR
jgi:hypothetical protein